MLPNWHLNSQLACVPGFFLACSWSVVSCILNNHENTVFYIHWVFTENCVLDLDIIHLQCRGIYSWEQRHGGSVDFIDESSHILLGFYKFILWNSAFFSKNTQVYRYGRDDTYRSSECRMMCSHFKHTAAWESSKTSFLWNQCHWVKEKHEMGVVSLPRDHISDL